MYHKTKPKKNNNKFFNVEVVRSYSSANTAPAWNMLT